MVKLVIDDPLRSRLSQLDDCAELYAADGTILGFFTPALPDWETEALKSPISNEELARRAERARQSPEQTCGPATDCARRNGPLHDKSH